MRKPNFLEDKISNLGPSIRTDNYSNISFLELTRLQKARRFQALQTYIGSAGFANTNIGANSQFPTPSIPSVTINYLVTEDGDQIITENGTDKLIV